MLSLEAGTLLGWLGGLAKLRCSSWGWIWPYCFICRSLSGQTTELRRWRVWMRYGNKERAWLVVYTGTRWCGPMTQFGLARRIWKKHLLGSCNVIVRYSLRCEFIMFWRGITSAARFQCHRLAESKRMDFENVVIGLNCFCLFVPKKEIRASEEYTLGVSRPH